MPLRDFGRRGRINTLATRLLDAAARRTQLEELAAEVEAALAPHPQWSGGKALLGLIRVRQGRSTRAGAFLEIVLADPPVDPPVRALVIVGQELKDDPSASAAGHGRLRAGLKTRVGLGYYHSGFRTVPLSTWPCSISGDGRARGADGSSRGRASPSRRSASNRGGSSGAASYRKLTGTEHARPFSSIGDPADACGSSTTCSHRRRTISGAVISESVAVISSASLRQAARRSGAGDARLEPARRSAATLRALVDPARGRDGKAGEVDRSTWS